MVKDDYKIENDLKRINNLIKSEYKNVPFDKAITPIRAEMNLLADKYNTTNVEIWKMFFDMISNLPNKS